MFKVDGTDQAESPKNSFFSSFFFNLERRKNSFTFDYFAKYFQDTKLEKLSYVIRWFRMFVFVGWGLREKTRKLESKQYFILVVGLHIFHKFRNRLQFFIVLRVKVVEKDSVLLLDTDINDCDAVMRHKIYLKRRILITILPTGDF